MEDFSSLRGCFSKYSDTWRVSLLLIGVVVSNRFANYSITGVYMDFLTGEWNTPIYAAAIVINLMSALTSLVSIVVANYATHAAFGRYHLIGLSLLPFITGLGLFPLAASNKFPRGPSIALFCVSLFLTANGEGMQKHTLFGFGYDQFMSQMEDAEKAERQAHKWWNAGRLLGTVGGLIASNLFNTSVPKSMQTNWWVFGGILSCGLTTVTSIIYILGKCSFSKDRHEDRSPIIDVLKVLVAAVRKRHLPYATDPSLIYEEGRNQTTAGNAMQREEIQTTEGTEIMNEEENEVGRQGLAGEHNLCNAMQREEIQTTEGTEIMNEEENGVGRQGLAGEHNLCNAMQREEIQTTEGTEIMNEEENEVGRQGLAGEHNPAAHSKLRCLEKASIIESPDQTKIHERQWRLCSSTKVKNAELVLRLLPLWSTFLMFQVVNAMGDTFFLEQGSAMVGDITVAILLAVQNGSQLLIGQVLLPRLKRVARLKEGIPPLVRIGIGLFISILCCIVSGIVERRRLDHVVPDELEAHMSIFCLVPQCFLLGAAVGFAEDGISDFFDTRVPQELRVCYRLISESVKGAGCLLNSLLLAAVHLFSRLGTNHHWIGDDLNTGKLHIFYFMIAGMSTMNLFFYCIISRKYVAGSSQDQHAPPNHERPEEDQDQLPTREDDTEDEPDPEEIDCGCC